MDATQVAERLRAILATTKTTQQDVAQIAGVALKTVNNLKHDRGGHEKAEEIAKALDQIEQAQHVGGVDYVIRLGRLERQVKDLAAMRDDVARQRREIEEIHEYLEELRRSVEGP